MTPGSFPRYLGRDWASASASAKIWGYWLAWARISLCLSAKALSRLSAKALPRLSMMGSSRPFLSLVRGMFPLPVAHWLWLAPERRGCPLGR